MSTPLIKWKIHCKASVESVYKLLSTDEGRSKFWAERTKEQNGIIHFEFPNGQFYESRIVEKMPPSKFSLIYFDSLVTFELSPANSGGTDLTVIHENVPASEYDDTKAGWISVLLTLKAYVDFGIDLRNHHNDRTWDQLYVDN